MGKRKILCIDFDGVIHSYTSGWQGEDKASDPPVIDPRFGDSSIDWLRSLIDARGEDGDEVLFDVCIYSSRSKYTRPSDPPGHGVGIRVMIEWLRRYGLEESYIAQIRFPTEKPAAFLTIDDRAICFDGHFPTVDHIDLFKPWNKK